MRRLAVLLASTLSMPVLAAQWQVDHEASRLGFVALQGGAEFDGSFGDWQASMRFDPDNLDESQFDVEIDVTSVDTDSADRDNIIGDPEWFGFEDFPRAHFKTTGFQQVGDNQYLATGDLSIRSVTREIELPFTWVIEGDSAEMDAEVVLDRTHYNVGTGDWASADMVGHEVRVVVDLSLQRVAD